MAFKPLKELSDAQLRFQLESARRAGGPCGSVSTQMWFHAVEAEIARRKVSA
jgi:hypothetical protein